MTLSYIHLFICYYYFLFVYFYLGDYTHSTRKYLMYFSKIIYSFYTLHFSLFNLIMA